MEDRQLAQTLVTRERVSTADMNRALEMQRNIGGQLAPILVKMGFIQDNELTSFMAEQEGMEWEDISQVVIPQALVNMIPREVIEKYQLIPVQRVGDTITVAVTDPLDLAAINDIQFLTGNKIETTLASKEQIRRAITRFYHEGGAREVLLGDLSEGSAGGGRHHFHLHPLTSTGGHRLRLRQPGDRDVREAFSGAPGARGR